MRTHQNPINLSHDIPTYNVLSNQSWWKRKLIKSWMHGWPSQCVMLCLSCSVCCARASDGRSSSSRVGNVRPRSGPRARGAESDKWGASVDRGQRAALTLASPLPARFSAPRSPRSHIIYDSIRARSKPAILYQLLIITRFSSHATLLFARIAYFFRPQLSWH